MRAIPQPKTHDDVALLEILSDVYSGIEVPRVCGGKHNPGARRCLGKAGRGGESTFGGLDRKRANLYLRSPKLLSSVNTNVNVTMGAANEQIRVSGWVKQILDRQRREGESYNDVLERMLEEESDRDLLAGFGRWSDEHADRVREARKKEKEDSKERMRQLAGDE